MPFVITAGEGDWKAVLQKDIALVDIKELPLTLTLKASTINEGAETLFDLRSVWLLQDAPDKSAPAPSPGAPPATPPAKSGTPL